MSIRGRCSNKHDNVYMYRQESRGQIIRQRERVRDSTYVLQITLVKNDQKTEISENLILRSPSILYVNIQSKM